MRRRRFLHQLGSAALGTALAGCARRPRQRRAGEPVTLVFKHAKHPRYEAVSEVIQQFEVQSPGIHIREELLPASTDEQHQFYVINLAGGAADFDLIDMDVIWVPEFARAGWLAEITPHLDDAVLAPLHRGALEADWLDGRLWGVPWFVDAGMLYYRADLLKRHGFAPPATFPELRDQARFILDREHDPRLAGYVWQGMQYEGLVCTALEMIRGNGGAVLRDATTPALADAATVEALEFMDGLIRRDAVSPPLVSTLNEEASRHVFQSGRAVFMRNWPYAWRLVNQTDSPVAGRVGMTLVPHFPGHASKPTLGGFHLGVNARTPFLEEAVKFLRFLVGYEVQKQILLHVGVLAAHTGIYSDPEVRAAMPWLPHLEPALERVVARPVTPYYLMISQILQPELSAIVSGIRTPRRAMEIAAQQVRHLLAPAEAGL